jgi:hypothetical protein
LSSEECNARSQRAVSPLELSRATNVSESPSGDSTPPETMTAPSGGGWNNRTAR